MGHEFLVVHVFSDFIRFPACVGGRGHPRRLNLNSECTVVLIEVCIGRVCGFLLEVCVLHAPRIFGRMHIFGFCCTRCGGSRFGICIFLERSVMYVRGTL